MVEFAGVVVSLLLSFLGMGFLWMGHPSGEILVAALFMLLAYSLSHARGKRIALLAGLLPAVPMALLIVQFRDPADSHLGSIAIVLAWLAGAVIGAFAANPVRTSYRRLLACIAGATVLHVLLTVAMIATSFGGAMQGFDGAAAGTPVADAWVTILMQPMHGIAVSAGHLPIAMQWLLLGVNSLAWGIPLGVLLAGALRLRRAPAPAAAG